MQHDGFTGPDDLYEYFLVDSATEPVVQTSRLRLAISAVQLFIQPAEDGHLEGQLATLPELKALGCQHAVLSFYQPPTAQQLQMCADLIE